MRRSRMTTLLLLSVLLTAGTALPESLPIRAGRGNSLYRPGTPSMQWRLGHRQRGRGG
jgi:hypothetical protein